MILRSPPSGVIERWQPELDRIAPRAERGHSHLMLVWEPGEDWAPVERWIVWEMLRPEIAPRIGVTDDLRGPPPRRFGRYLRGVGFRRTRNFTITQHQWEIHRDTGYYGRPLWIVQGKRGGHKRFWSDVEYNMIRMKLGEDVELDPPAPGDLCYAEPDDRTIRSLASIDIVRKYGDVLRYAGEMALRGALDRREREIGRTMAEKLWHWMGDQVNEALEITRKDANLIWAHADASAPVDDYEAGEAEFIEEVGAGASL